MGFGAGFSIGEIEHRKTELVQKSERKHAILLELLHDILLYPENRRIYCEKGMLETVYKVGKETEVSEVKALCSVMISTLSIFAANEKSKHQSIENSKLLLDQVLSMAMSNDENMQESGMKLLCEIMKSDECMKETMGRSILAFDLPALIHCGVIWSRSIGNALSSISLSSFLQSSSSFSSSSSSPSSSSTPSSSSSSSSSSLSVFPSTTEDKKYISSSRVLHLFSSEFLLPKATTLEAYLSLNKNICLASKIILEVIQNGGNIATEKELRLAATEFMSLTLNYLAEEEEEENEKDSQTMIYVGEDESRNQTDQKKSEKEDIQLMEAAKEKIALSFASAKSSLFNLITLIETKNILKGTKRSGEQKELKEDESKESELNEKEGILEKYTWIVGEGANVLALDNVICFYDKRWTTCAFNQVIDRGIWQMELFFTNVDEFQQIGVINSDAEISIEGGSFLGHNEDSAAWQSNGCVSNMGLRREEQHFYSGQFLLCEVDFTEGRRELHFFCGETQIPAYFTNLPAKVRFAVYSFNPTVACIRRIAKVSKSKAKKIPGAKMLPWLYHH